MIYDLTLTGDIEQAKFKLDYFINNNKKIEIKEIKPKRSLNQNSYLHLIFGLFGLEFGLTLDETKQLIKYKFLSYEKKGKTFVKQTSKLDTKEMTIFIEQFRNFASKQGVYIPAPDEKEKLKSLQDYMEKYEKYIK